MIKVAITGAAGFIGTALAAHLSAKGYEVHGSDMVHKTGVDLTHEFTVVDLLNSSDLRQWLHRIQPEIVYHLGARTDLRGVSAEDYSANIAGVENVVLACSIVSSVKRVIFASSRMVCKIDYQPVGYDDYCPPNAYGESKVEGELIVKNAKVNYEWVLVRPTSIWGPGFGIPYRNFFDQVRKRRYVNPGSHKPRKSFGYVGNTVFQLARLIEVKSSLVDRKTFYLGDYEPVEVGSWASYIHKQFGFSGAVRTVPIHFLWLAAKTGDVFNKITGKDAAPLTTFRLNNLVTHMVYPQLNELEAVTGPLPYTWQQGTEETVKWLKENEPRS